MLDKIDALKYWLGRGHVEENAVLIDVSGTGCYTFEWLSPELKTFLEQNPEKFPVSADALFDEQVAADSRAEFPGQDLT
ncbi:hypothetical protein N7493_005062 [Penicillium malachiteum]|uniref:Uncharacterized protein n=1 Tax=Penicillium malachiteum TaxID=1324776 RepID=A0AAD6MWH5_9EURO|nr:hypothetical protein N7493_005062 [Penicillium malachiteum]